MEYQMLFDWTRRTTRGQDRPLDLDVFANVIFALTSEAYARDALTPEQTAGIMSQAQERYENAFNADRALTIGDLPSYVITQTDESDASPCVRAFSWTGNANDPNIVAPELPQDRGPGIPNLVILTHSHAGEPVALLPVAYIAFPDGR